MSGKLYRVEYFSSWGGAAVAFDEEKDAKKFSDALVDVRSARFDREKLKELCSTELTEPSDKDSMEYKDWIVDQYVQDFAQGFLDEGPGYIESLRLVTPGLWGLQQVDEL